MTLAEWIALPEDNSRYFELVDGVIYAGPKEWPFHQTATGNLTALLDRALPDELIAVPQVEVVIAGDPLPTVRVPDITVAPFSLVKARAPRFVAADVSLLVEIMSPHTRERDQITKLAEYARAGIPHYWVIDLDEPGAIKAYALADGQYAAINEAAGLVELSEPVAMSFDISRLGESKYPFDGDRVVS